MAMLKKLLDILGPEFHGVIDVLVKNSQRGDAPTMDACLGAWST
ncbi:hypothetical protein ACODUI_19405 [Stenotrophomonas geniculata]